MSISDFSSYEGLPSKLEWSKDDFLAYIDEGENLSETSAKGFNLMHVAVTFGWQDIVEALNNADPAMKDSVSDIGNTPAMQACVFKKTGIVKFLLEQGADPKIVNDTGSNLLHYACTHGVLQGNHSFIQILTYSLGCRRPVFQLSIFIVIAYIYLYIYIYC